MPRRKSAAPAPPSPKFFIEICDPVRRAHALKIFGTARLPIRSIYPARVQTLDGDSLWVFFVPVRHLSILQQYAIAQNLAEMHSTLLWRVLNENYRNGMPVSINDCKIIVDEAPPAA